MANLLDCRQNLFQDLRCINFLSISVLLILITLTGCVVIKGPI
jgi:hypothetical protein